MYGFYGDLSSKGVLVSVIFLDAVNLENILNWSLGGKSMSMANWQTGSCLGLELEALKQRFWRHANPAAAPRAHQTVNVNIIVKDLSSDGKEELKADVVPVTLAAEKLEETSHTKPGICLHYWRLCGKKL